MQTRTQRHQPQKTTAGSRGLGTRTAEDARGLGQARAAVTAVAALLLAVLPAGRATGAPDPNGQRAWPVTAPGGREPPTVVRGFEPPPLPWSPGHRGADLAATPGAQVRAAAPGRITFAGTVAGQGVVTVELTGTGTPPLRTTYEPVRATLPTGTQVAAGQPVGVLLSGPFHCPAGCLHWGLLRGDVYLDPLTLIPAPLRRHGPSRLLPLVGVEASAGSERRDAGSAAVGVDASAGSDGLAAGSAAVAVVLSGAAVPRVGTGAAGGLGVAMVVLPAVWAFAWGRRRRHSAGTRD
ncbi:M23 family metallopeptidase [Streptomyces sp. RPT161]|uniref:M23 family metallopeptidase n=1 Tax=Streptomyces sp. RPT161 TaxID=3015993 RepID=UPI0022B8ABA0|nr:M23 family metallopeptidase [Streptomyces sp. RPT161]